MSFTLSKDLVCTGKTHDGGFNFEQHLVPLKVTKQYISDDQVVVVEGLTSEGVVTLNEIKSLLEDMEYLHNKD